MNKVELVKVDLENNYTHRLEEAHRKVSRLVEVNNRLGFKVISITPLITNNSEYQNMENESYGFGYSFTSGLLVVFEEIS